MNELFPIDPSVVSYQEAKNSLETLIASRPDNQKWSQFYASSSGQITVEIVSALLTYLKFDSISARREAFLQHAKTRSGVIAGGQALGYSAFRGRNSIIEITFTPSGSGVYPKYYQLGSVAGFGLVLLESVPYVSSIPLTVQCVVGDILSETLIAQSDSIEKFRFTQRRVSQDIRIFVNNNEIGISDDILKVAEGTFYIQSNPIGSVDALSLNEPQAVFNYVVGSQIRLDYIELRDVIFTLAAISLDSNEGTLNNSTIVELYAPPEVNSSIQLKAPLQNETKFLIRGRNDYQKLLLLSNQDFISAGARDTSKAAEVEIFAVKSNLSVLTILERAEFLDFIANRRPFGVRPPFIIDPVPNFLEVKIEATLSNVVGIPAPQIRNILSQYEKKLSSPEEVQSVSFKKIESQITALSIILISRVFVSPRDWLDGTVFRRGYHTIPSTPNGFIYEALDFLRYTSNSEPTCPAPIPLPFPATGFIFGQTIEDNGILWSSIEQDNTLDLWQANTSYNVGDRVRWTGATTIPDASFEVIGLLHKSKSGIVATFASQTYETATYTADTIGTIGNLISLVFDGIADIDTIVGAWNLANPTNTVSFVGALGSEVPLAGTVNLIGGVDSFDGEPLWPIPALPPEIEPQTFVEDNQLIWLMIEKFGAVDPWEDNKYYQIGDVVIPTIVQSGQEEIMFQAVAVCGNSGSVEPVFPLLFGETVIDNEIRWVTRNISGSPESPRDNEYFLIYEENEFE